MNRTALALLAASALSIGVAQPSLAAAKTKPAKPISETMYLHGTSTSGNQDVFVDGTPLTMSTVKPTASADKDIMFFGAGVSPNTDCAGGSLLPYWTGAVKGTLSGKVAVSFFARSTPGATATLQLFTDAGEGGCNELNPGAIAEVTVPLKAGATNALHTATIELPKALKVKETLHFQVLPGMTAGVAIGPQVSGVGYDSTVSPSAITFTCLPNAGKKSC